MTQSIIAYERTREEELHSIVRGYWCNSGTLFITKSRETLSKLTHIVNNMPSIRNLSTNTVIDPI